MITQVVNKAALSGNIKAFLSLLPHIQAADALAQARKERSSRDTRMVDTLAQAVQYIADMGLEIPVPRARREPKQVEARGPNHITP